MSLPLPLGVTAVMLPELDIDDQIALCTSVGVTHYCFRPRPIPQTQVGKAWGNWGNHKFDLTPERLLKEGKEFKKKFDDAGMTIFGCVPLGTVADRTDEEMKLNLEGAALVGAGRIRLQPEVYPKGPFDYQAYLEKQIEGYARAVAMAKPYGIKWVIETHCRGAATSPGLALNLCKSFSPDEVGTILDIANFNIEGFVQPNLAIAVLGDYIDHVHIGGGRTLDGEYDEFGFRKAGHRQTAITDSDMHMPSWIAALHEAGRDVPLVIEDYTPEKTGTLRLTETATALRRILEAE